MLRRLLAALFFVAVSACLALPALAQDKDKDKGKEKEKEKPKEAPKEKPKEANPTPTTTPAGDKAALKWKFVKGTAFYQKMVTKTDQKMKVMNNDVNQTQNQTFYFSFTPTEVSDKAVTIEQKITGVAMDIEIGGSKISYDSTKDQTANNPLGEFFKALKDSKFTIEFDPVAGKVTNVKGRDEFIGKLVTANPQMKPLLETILSAEALKEMAEPTFAVVPGKEVAKGEKWTRTSNLDMGPIGKYENVYTYTYEGSDKDAAKIKFDTALTYKQPGDTAGGGGLPFKIKSATLKSSNPVGAVTFDAKKGRLVSSKTTLELKGDLEIEIGGQNTKVTLSQTQDSSIETSDDDPTKKK